MYTTCSGLHYLKLNDIRSYSRMVQTSCNLAKCMECVHAKNTNVSHKTLGNSNGKPHKCTTVQSISVRADLITL